MGLLHGIGVRNARGWYMYSYADIWTMKEALRIKDCGAMALAFALAKSDLPLDIITVDLADKVEA